MSADRVDAYLKTVERIEPDVTPIDQTGALASIAISLKRIADACDYFKSLAEDQIKKDRDRT